MKKGILYSTLVLAAAVLVACCPKTSHAADLSSVGSLSAELVGDYSYSRTIDTVGYGAVHQGVGGLQLNLEGVGSFALEAGDTQTIGDYRLNYPTFGLTYANGFNVGSLKLVGAVSYGEATGDRWLPIVHGTNSAAPLRSVGETVEASLPVASRVRLFVDGQHANDWSQGSSVNGNGAAAGAYVGLTQNVSLKAGYTRSWSTVDSQGLLLSVNYTFAKN